MIAGQTYTLGELAARFAFRLHVAEADVEKVASVIVAGFATLQHAQGNQLSFFANKAYRNQLRATQAAAVILSASEITDCPVPCLIADNPYLAYAKVSALFDQLTFPDPGVHPTAVVHPTATVSPTASIGPHVVIEHEAVIGDGVVIGAGCVVGSRTSLGARTFLHPRVVLYHGVTVGSDVVLHSGVVIGADGFGFAKDNGQWCKIHQLGGVIIGNYVEIGANTCIDRGAIDDTVISNSVIIDNHVQIAHNVSIGEGTAIAACSGIAGSTTVGAHCTIAGAVGIVGHLTIVDGVHITAKSLVTGSIMQSGSYSSGTAMQPTATWRKNAVRFLQLDTLFDRVRVLESHINSKK